LRIESYSFGKIRIAGVEPTGQAVAEYNRLVEEGADAIAALHLTC
jgi:hypothetical protein